MAAFDGQLSLFGTRAMSYALHPFAVSLTGLKKMLGSRDAKLLVELKRKFARDYAETDAIDDEGELPSMEQGMEHLVMGKEQDKDAGYKYGYCLKCLCEHSGSMLSNDTWSSMRWSWFEEVDEALKQAKVDPKVFGIQSHLASRGSPIPIPRIDDFPSIGYVLESEIGKVTMELGKLKGKEIDVEVTESLDEARQWLDHCARSHKDLICFYH